MECSGLSQVDHEFELSKAGLVSEDGSYFMFQPTSGLNRWNVPGRVKLNTSLNYQKQCRVESTSVLNRWNVLG